MMGESRVGGPMDAIAGKRIVLGVSGGIAAYKAIEVMRRLVDAGAHVVPVLTEDSLNFVGRTTFSALASEPAQVELFDNANPIPHTRLGQGADLVLIAPATARIISDYRTGRSADLLSATLLATAAPVILAPAMHTEMWENPAVAENLQVLAKRGATIVPAEEGRLAGGDTGKGRLAAPETIVAIVDAVLAGVNGSLAGQKVVVTAGGTREPLDPVRFLGNRSSGKQGYALASEARVRGAEVTLISSADRQTPSGVEIIRVETAAEMHSAVVAAASVCDVLVMAAAVADFRPAEAADDKLKKSGGVPNVTLVPTEDILMAVDALRRPDQMIVGFAAETTNLRENAAEKLSRKGVDVMVANDVSKPKVGFGHDTNEVLILTADGAEQHISLTDKSVVARAVFDHVVAGNRSENPRTKTGRNK